jgi:hypothetical protein
MRRLAIRSALSGKVVDGQLHVVDKISFAEPRTKEMVSILHNVGIQRSALVVTGEPDRSVLVSARNIQKTKVLPAAYLNVVDLLTHRDLVLTEEAVRRVEGLWGATARAPAAVEEPKPRRRRASAAQEPPAEAEVAVEEPKSRRRRAPAAQKPPAEAEVTVEEPKPKPRRRKAAAAASTEAKETAEKPARRTRRPKAKADGKTVEAAEEPKPPRPRRARAKPAASQAEGKEEEA